LDQSPIELASMLLSFLLASSVALVAAQTTTRATPVATGQPCAVVSSLLRSSTNVPAQAAYDCLQSVPVDTEGDKKLIDELKLAWQWNTEIGWLKNPPSDWKLGKLDVIGELDNIKNNLGSFKSEYDVQRAIEAITVKTGNFHFNWSPDIFSIFTFFRALAVTSLSSDGKELPKIYTSFEARRQSTTKSAIVKINDEESYAYLVKIAALEQYIDDDGRLNAVLAKGFTALSGSFRIQTHYDGPTTKLEFANGTVLTLDNLATTSRSFTGVTDGKSFFDKFCGGTSTLTSASNADEVEEVEELADNPQGALTRRANKPRTISERLDNNPQGALKNERDVPSKEHIMKRQLGSGVTTVAESTAGDIGGYFLEGDGYSDVAVFRISTFSPEGDSSGTDFQKILKTFLERSISEKKTKLVIDLRENGGGAPHLIFDTYFQLFPGQEPYSAQRYRAEEQYLAIGEAVNQIKNDPNLLSAYNKKTPSRDLDFDNKWRIWAYWHYTTAKGESFPDWKSYSGPQVLNSDSFTVTNRQNYSNADRVSILPDGFDFISGPGRTQAFEAKNIVMFTDAACGSACAGIHEELKNVAGVKSVTVGGRPVKEPIQPVTGSKGGEVRVTALFPSLARNILSYTSLIGATVPTNQKLQQLANITQLTRRIVSQGTRVQTQDQLRKGDKTGTPLQYIYEAADCKIFYTQATWLGQEAAWKAAFDAFQDDSKCVEGSTKHKTSISGGFVPYGPQVVKDEDIPKPDGTTNNNPTPTGSGSPTGTGKKGAGERVRVGAAALLVVAAAVALL